MNLKDYIKQSYLRPNKQVLQSLGANEKLIRYLLKTPWNTNLSIIDSISESGEDMEKIWYTGSSTPIETEGVYMLQCELEETEDANTAYLLRHPEDCNVFLNEVELINVPSGTPEMFAWYDDETNPSVLFASYRNENFPVGIVQKICDDPEEVTCNVSVVKKSNLPTPWVFNIELKGGGLGFEGEVPTDTNGNFITGRFDIIDNYNLERIGEPNKELYGISIYNNNEVFLSTKLDEDIHKGSSLGRIFSIEIYKRSKVLECIMVV